MKISELKLNENNPRQISEAKLESLKKSIQDFGKMLSLRPIVVDEEKTVLGGNMRLRALQALGYDEIPDEWVKQAADLTEEEKRQFIIKDNVGFGEWDWDALGNGWDADELTDWGLEIPEWAMEEELEAQEDDYQIPDEIHTDVVAGDLIEIGRHRLLCGDSTISDDVDKLMDGEKADMVFTDPPYGINKEGITNDDLEGSEFYKFSSDYISIAPVKADVGMVCYHSTRTFYHTLNAFIDNGWKFEKMLFFYRPDKMPVHTWNGWMMTSQAIMLFSKGKPEYKSISPAHQDVYKVTSKDLTDKLVKHPTVKPVTNCIDLLTHYESNLAYDPFLGSGTTMVATHQLNRTCYGMEIDPKYCQVIIDRMIKLDPGIEVKINGKIYEQKIE